ncbi:MAG TPA: diphosphomevalonate decarboxylase [Bacteroidales bacterium]|nr:diphosphomevalonate decarboxylase [Bacteroidales bacterium]HOK98667.1 diphosphomevalonate decarboxylase [Bacteroidales bacterium]HPO65069.1 diphosphomevalonate decarboxylase [Bacteroidales bacterium]
MRSFRVKWKSPANIALVKYWGKNGHQLPANASLSMTLSEAFATTEVTFSPLKNEGGPVVTFTFENNTNEIFQQRIERYLQYLKENEMPFLQHYRLDIQSQNSFPHSAGIASSAAFMSSLALCLCSVEEQLYEGIGYSFFERASYIARLGSGSAARSVYGGYVSWGRSKHVPHSSDEYASPVNKTVHPSFMHYVDTILIVSEKPKAVSSSAGHRLMNDHPFQLARYRQAALHHEELLRCLLCEDRQRFVEIVENEALQLHALMMTSHPSYILMEPATLFVIQQIRQFRSETGIPVCFTLDAGPNIHVLYAKDESVAVENFINNQIIPSIAQPVRVMYDRLGNGPEQLFFEFDK